MAFKMHVHRTMQFVILVNILLCIAVQYLEARVTIDAPTTASSLQLVQIIHVHGQCVPSKKYFDVDNDQLSVSSLTNAGKWQQYELGRSLGRRYDRSILRPNDYNVSRVRARSADRDCSLTSTYCLLAGLYPPQPSSEQQWKIGLNWQPIPVHTLPINLDCILEGNGCNDRQINSTDELKSAITVEDQEFLELLTKLTGTSVTSPDDVIQITEFIALAREYNVSIPIWVDEYGSRIEVLAADATYRRTHKTQELRWLESASLLDEIVSNMQGKMDSMDPEIKERVLYIYTTEASVAHSLMSLLNLSIPLDLSSPQISGLFTIEMHRDLNRTWVQFLYGNRQLNMRCPLDVLVQLVNENNPASNLITLKCHFGNLVTGSGSSLFNSINLAITSGVVFMAAIILIVMVGNRKSNINNISSYNRGGYFEIK